MTHVATNDQTTPQFATYQATRHFGSLNGLRFFCIMAVIWHHSPVWTALESPARILTRGFVGVDFFFVLSGFLITTLLLREAQANGSFSLSGFYWRRFLRIIPVYFLVVTMVATYYIAYKGETQYLDLLPFYYLFLSNFLTNDIPLLAPTWSLSVEEQYYLVWPLLLLVLPRRMILPTLSALIALNVIAVTGWLAPLGIHAFDLGVLRLEMFTATYAPILIGSAVAILLHTPRSFGWIAHILGHNISCVISFGVLLILLQILPLELAGWPNLVMHIVMSVCLASIVLRENHILKPILAARPIARVGEISYGVYLYHLIGLHISNVLLGRLGLAQEWYVLICYTLVSIIIAEISFRTFERYFLNLKHKVT